MNVVDWIIVGIIGISVLFGLYRGFIASVASLGATLLSWGGSYLLTPKVVDFVTSNTSLRETLASNINISKQLGDNAGSLVSSLNDGKIADIVADIPKPLDTIVEKMLSSAGNATATVSDYIRDHLVDAALNVICFIGCFLILMLVGHLIITLLKTIFKFPVLKQLNTTVGGLFGLLRGVLICFVLFAAVPLVQAILSAENISMIDDLVAGSTFAPFFNNGKMIESITSIHI